MEDTHVFNIYYFTNSQSAEDFLFKLPTGFKQYE